MTDPRTFYTETIPAQFNAAFQAQERMGEAGRELYEALQAVTATIRVEITGEDGGTFFLNIEAGRMQAGDAAACSPFISMRQDRPAFDALVSEVGESAMALLGGLSGLTGGMHLTAGRVENLAGLNGCVAFEVEGEGGFRIVSQFGEEASPEEPGATIRVQRRPLCRPANT